MLSVLALLAVSDLGTHGLRLGDDREDVYRRNSHRLLQPAPLDRGLYDNGTLGDIAQAGTLVITRINISSPRLRSKTSTATNSKVQFRPAALPKVIVQLGDERTATTLQFQSLCATMFLLHGAESDHVECFYAGHLKGLSPLDAEGESRYYVVKTHGADVAKAIIEKYAPGDAWLFVTTKNATSTKAGVDDWQPSAAQAADELGMDVAHAQDMYILKLRGYMIVADYMYVFALSEHQSESLFQYLRYWSILRQCCGVQMSKDQFAILHNQEPTHHSPTSPNNPACDIYNLSAVESRLVHSELMENQAKTPPMLRRASTEDDYFTGGYCAWFYRQVKCQSLKFNAKPRHPGC